MEDIKVLKKLPLFHNLENMELVEVAKAVHTKKFSAGDTVIRQGETGGAFYVLKTGTAIVFLVKEDGQKKLLGRFQPGDSFGEVSLIDRGSRSASVEAESDLELLTINRERFQELINRTDTLSLKLLHNLLHDLCDKLRRTNHFLLLSE
ncbi:MAG TPA: cyclic nucleotide-binding domain-containing protein [Thermoanaerobaculia bacterium]|nr:cyclic nucleotide-binding domain-containing protein [Thermoanaerobaculia bacterium]HUM29880.1 cyclic nucleotide-binding domain-containing protein [Thermoanaerobaculia bacterium]HXK68253.1 cyclic nucleotide-binding domain-containing protein [Thermoanaerobaculia bacterium]